MTARHWAGALAAIALYFATLASAKAEEAKLCYGLEELKVAFRIVFPILRQVTMEGGAARAYLDGYNTFGDQTYFQADTLLLNILPNGLAMVSLFNRGVACERIVVGPNLHKIIMAIVERGAI